MFTVKMSRLARTLTRSFRDLALSLGLAWLATACAYSRGPTIAAAAERINATLSMAPATIGPGDRLEISFAYAPTWNQQALVPKDGLVGFLGLDEIQVIGFTTEELDDRLSSAYKPLLENASLVVSVREPAPRYVSVLGELREPKEVEFPRDRHLTLVEALARAGGPKKETAYLSSTVLVRWDAKQKRQLAWTLDARPEFWSESNTIFLQPEDIVYVPNTPIDDLGIWVDNYIRRLIPLPLFPAF